MRQKKAVSLILLLIILLSVCLSLCSCTSLESTKEESAAVLQIGGRDVPYELYRYLVLHYRDEILPDGADKTDEYRQQITDSVIAALRDIYAVFSLAGDYDIDPESDYVASAVDSAVESAKVGFDKDSDYKASLAESYMNDSVFRLLEKKNACSDELYYAMIKAGDINTDKDYMKSIIDSDSFICVKQILVVGQTGKAPDADGSFTAAKTHTDDEAEAIAAEAQARAAAGEDFDALVAEYGESLYMFGNTDGYYLCRGMWDDENTDAAFALAAGEVSPVVKSDKGFSVFKRFEKSQSYIDSHFDEICKDWYSALFTLALEKRAAELEIDETELYKSYDVFEMN